MNKVRENIIGCFDRSGSLLAGVTLACTLLMSGEAAAILMNPNPAIFANDDGSTVFVPSDPVVAFERLDPLSDNPGLAIPTFFGFYFDGTDGVGENAAVIFDNSDQVNNAAVVDFSLGRVFDFDEGAAQVGGAFTNTPGGTGNIGFWLAVLYPGQVDYTTFYTDPILNSGFDLAATFHELLDPSSYMTVFEVPFGVDTLRLAYRAKIGGINAVTPEPSIFSLFGLGLVAMVLRRKRLWQRSRFW